MPPRPFVCECCAGRMVMTEREYNARSAGGRLVFCDRCFRREEPRRMTKAGRVVADVPERVLRWRRAYMREQAR